MRPLRIGVNALYLIPGQVGGTEIYLRNLVAALAKEDHEYFVFTNVETGPLVGDRVHAQVQKLRAVNRPVRLIWEQTKLPIEARRLRLDCMLNAGFTAPVFTACPNVTVFHDMQHKQHPEHFRWFDLPAWRFFLWAAAHRSQILIADSEATKADIMHFYGIASQRIRVVHLGVEDEFFRIAEQRTTIEPFLLCASTLHPHKNLDRLIRAFDQFRRSHTEFKLIITGVRGFYTEALEKLIGESVELRGWVPRTELYELFRRAHGFVYPSTFEGFGLPVIEAMAAGIPLACSDIEPLRSLVADAALRFDPSDTDALVSAMHRLTEDHALRESLSRAGRERASRFTWDACARGTLEAIYQAIEEGPRAGS